MTKKKRGETTKIRNKSHRKEILRDYDEYMPTDNLEEMDKFFNTCNLLRLNHKQIKILNTSMIGRTLKQ